MDKFNRSRPRNISSVEAIAAVFVLFIWSAVFLAAATVILTYFQSQAEVTVMEGMPASQIVMVMTETPTPSHTATPEPTRTSSPTSTVEPSETPTPAAVLQLPTPTFTRVILPTTAPVQDGDPTAISTVTPTFTPMPTYTIVPTYVYAAQVAMAEDGSLIHSVSTGETLSRIAAMYGTTVENLVRVNQIEDAARISVGQRLSIPERKEVVSVKAAPLPGIEPVLNSPSKPAAPPPLASDMPAPPPPAGDPPTRLIIPKIELDTPIIEVSWRIIEENGRRFSEWDVADNAAGWHHGSAFPGNVGNTVISGHHNIKGEVFRNLVDLEAGDSIYLYVGEQPYPYVVTEKHILREKGMPDEVRSQNARWIAKTTDERITLVTCWPYTNNTHRVIVVARPTWRMS